MTIQPYLLVPKLIPQPTWGGEYIADFKGLPKETFGSMKLGQSYELATDSMLSTVERSTQLPVEMCTASDGSTQEVIGDRTTMFSLQDLINQDPERVLGKNVVAKHGNRMHVLIKFTQAKGNSFQVHVRPSSQVGQWKPKPESWYFFEKGKVTLGLKSPIDRAGYMAACKTIEQKALEVSEKMKNHTVTPADGKKELLDCITAHSPFAFVNEFTVEPETIVDLSDGGIHHSWEEGADIPMGNIVYEVQLNVMDKDCTLRSFDKGKIGDDGALRPIHIDEYFQAINSDEAANVPAQYMRTALFHSVHGAPVAKLFATQNYSSILMEIASSYTGDLADTRKQGSFHHLFVKTGTLRVEANGKTYHVSKGASIFIPASTGPYTLKSEGTCQIIATWV